MSDGAQIKDGYIEIDTDKWLEERTGGPLDEVTDLYREFDEFVSRQTSLRLDTVPMFITARCGSEWRDAEFAVIQTPDGGGTVNLSDDMLIHRYIDPIHGPVAFVTTDWQFRAGYTTAYADSGHDSTEWFSYHDANIYCPAGHGWRFHGEDLTDDTGTYQTTRDVFPGGEIVTWDDGLDSETYGEYRIICPTCGAKCDVSMPEQ